MQREKNETSDRSDSARASNALVIIEPPLGVSGDLRRWHAARIDILPVLGAREMTTRS